MVERFLQRPGYRLYCCVYGKGPAVLVLHDGASSSLALNHRRSATLIDWLWRYGFRVATFDMREYGRSGGLGSFGERFFQDCADDARAVMDSVDLDRAVVIGIGDGGVVGLNVAIRHPARVQAIVADSPKLHGTPAVASAARQLRKRHDPRWRSLLSEIQGSQQADEMLRAYADFWSHIAQEKIDPYDGRLEEVECPVLVLASAPEPLGLAEQCREMADRLSCAASVIVHNRERQSSPVLCVAPASFRAAVKPFLDEQVGALTA